VTIGVRPEEIMGATLMVTMMVLRLEIMMLVVVVVL